jgi:mannose-6-phosphate isomerase-like protein (cupin superfamily)
MDQQPVRMPGEWGQSAFERFLREEDLPVVNGLAVPSLHDIEVAPWGRLDARGSYVQLFGAEDTNAAYVLELPAGKSTVAERHLCEEVMFVLSGRGTCEVWNEAGDRQTFEWQEGSLFAIPLNTFHRFHNGSGQEAARLLGVTTLPLMLNLTRNTDFIFDCPYDFRDRFAAEDNYFSGKGTLFAIPDSSRKLWETNFIADVHGFELYEWAERGAGGKNIKFELADNAMVAHVSEFPVGTYKKCHRHGPGAHVIILDGEGFSLMWPDGADRMEEIDWHPGSMFVPPGMWWHQHFNSGPKPARYLAIRWGGAKYKVTRYLDHQGIDKNAKEGGNQIEYADQDPRVHRRFLERCAENGVEVRMSQFEIPV